MRGLRVGLGFAVGALLVRSGLGHSILGWKALSIGWRFGGVAMIAFGCILITMFGRIGRGRPASRGPVLVIAALRDELRLRAPASH